MRTLLFLLSLVACDGSDQNGQPDLAVMGTCPSANSCNPDDHCTYPGFEPTTCVCVSPERVACCSGGAGANCSFPPAVHGGVCCGTAIPNGTCGNGCRCVANHWECPDAGQ